MRIVLTFFVVVTLSMRLSGQWFLQPQGGPSVASNEVEFVSNDTGYLCGQLGAYRTTDGAQSWLQIPLGTTNLDQGFYNSVRFQTFTQGCIVGTTLAGGATVLMTHNAGLTWTSFLFGTSADVAHEVNFSGTQVGYVVATNGFMNKTTDGGLSWQPLASTTSQHLYAAEFISVNHGFIGGVQTFKRTVDGGATWSNVPGIWTEVRDIAFVDSLNGYVIDNGTIFKTTDGGNSWTDISDGLGNLGKMYFHSQSVGYAMTASYLGVYKTVDGGGYWSTQTVDSTLQPLLSMTFFDDTTGYICGFGGTVLKTVNGGGTSFFPYNDAGADTIFPVLCNGVQPVSCVLKNFGVDTLYSAQIQWSVDLVSQTSYVWTGLLTPGNSITVSLGNFAFSNGSHLLQANTINPNSVSDDRAGNDSSSVVFVTTNCSFNDAGVFTVDSPTSFLTSSGSYPVLITIKNFGINPISSATIAWELNGVAQTNYLWTGNVASGATVGVITIGNGNFVPGSNLVKVWTTSPNGNIDNYNTNDTLYYGVYCCNGAMSGAFQLGGINRDFNTFNDAVTALSVCGVNGPVVVDVDTGIYFEKVTIPFITGSSVLNTITFQSVGGDSSSVVLTHALNSLNYDQNYTLRFDSACHITFSRISIASTDTTYYAVIEFMNSASFNTITHCQVYGIPDSTIGGMGGALVISQSVGATNESNNCIDHNIMVHAYIGIDFRGTSTQHEMRNNIIFNTIEVAHRAIMLGRQGDQLIEGNKIRVSSVDIPLTQNNFSYGISCLEAYDSVVVNGNSINMPDGGYRVGIFVASSNDPIAPLITNNFVRVNSQTGAWSYCLYINYTKARLYNNSLLITGGNEINNKVIYLVGLGNTGNTMMNNILCSYAGGKVIYYGQTQMAYSGDYNLLYPVEIYNGMNYSSLTAWQATGHDVNSLSIQPPFVSLDDLHLQSWNNQVDGTGTPLSFIVNDIDLETRDPLTPDIGADEYIPSVILASPNSVAENPLNVFPNPATDVVHIDMGESYPRNAIVSIFDMCGTSVMQQTFLATSTNSSLDVNVSELPAGVYWIMVNSGEITNMLRLVKL